MNNGKLVGASLPVGATSIHIAGRLAAGPASVGQATTGDLIVRPPSVARYETTPFHVVVIDDPVVK